MPTAKYMKGGKRVPGVTTVISRFKQSAGLIGWAGKTCTEIAYQAGRNKEPEPYWQDILYTRRDDAAEAGTIAHYLFDGHLRGLFKSVTVQEICLEKKCSEGVAVQALQAYENALTWKQQTSLEIEPFETPIVHDLYAFGGAPDAYALAKESADNFVTDWKTGKVYSDHIIQCSAYAMLLEQHLGKKMSGIHLVRFNKETGDFAHYFYDRTAIDQGWKTFLLMLELYSEVKVIEKRAA